MIIFKSFDICGSYQAYHIVKDCPLRFDKNNHKKICYAQKANMQQQYHVVPGPIGLVGLNLGLGRRASWAVHGIGAWVHGSLGCA